MDEDERNADYLGEHEALLLFAVVVAMFVAHFDAAFDEGRHQRRQVRRVHHGQVAARAMVRRGRQIRVAVVLRFEEVGQDVVVGPPGVAQIGPAVVVEPVAAIVQHVVDGRRTAQHFSGRPQAPLPYHSIR